jgi:hypothetical protein
LLQTLFLDKSDGIFKMSISRIAPRQCGRCSFADQLNAGSASLGEGMQKRFLDKSDGIVKMSTSPHS